MKNPQFFLLKSLIKIFPGFLGCVPLPGLAISVEVELLPNEFLFKAKEKPPKNHQTSG